MKTQKIMRSIFSLVLASIIIMGISIPAFAATTNEKPQVKTSANLIAETTITVCANDETVVPYASVNDPVEGTVAANGTMTLNPYLNNYVGFTRRFSLLCTPMSEETPTGTLSVYLHKSNGDVLDYWILSPHDSRMETYTLPSSGKYTLRVYSNVNVPVFVTATWCAT